MRKKKIPEKPQGKFAWSATVGEKGQIVIPKQARELFGIKPGDTILIFGDEQRGIVIPPKDVYKDLYDTLFDAINDRS